MAQSSLKQYLRSLRWTPLPVGVGLALIAFQQYRHTRKREAAKIGTLDPCDCLADEWSVEAYKLLPLRYFSRAWGWVNGVELPEWSRKSVLGLYVRTFGCKMEEAEVEDLGKYKCLAELFRRSLKDGARPVDPSAPVVSPVDGTILSFGTVSCGQLEQVKGVSYPLRKFLGPNCWTDGCPSIVTRRDDDDCYHRSCLKDVANNQLYQCVIYLAPGDYHRFHSSADWQVAFRRHFPGDLLSVNPRVATWVRHLFVLNERALERIITKTLYHFLDDHLLFDNAQFGFRAKRAVTDQLLLTYNKITLWYDTGLAVDLILFDFIKAFDRVHHPTLLRSISAHISPKMSEEVGSVRPNPYIFDIENRRKRKPRLAHDLGAGAKCNKCGDKCPGFELHFWRKICQNCRCGKDDHDVEDEDEDIGQFVIGKLFERPARTKKEELEYSFGNDLEIVNEETGKPEKMKFDWVPPNIGKNLAARYMAQLPPSKRPVAGTEAAKERKKQLEQQLPLYDVDETRRCDNMPAEELQSFMEYLDRIKTKVAGQGMVQEIIAAPTKLMAQPLSSSQLPKATSQVGVGDANTNYAPGTDVTLDNLSHLASNQGPVDNELYSRPYGQPRGLPDRRNSGLRDFMGGMIQDYHNMNLASSEPYGVAPNTSQPLMGLGKHLEPGMEASVDLEKKGHQQVESPAQFIVSPGSGQYGNSSSQPYGGQKQYTGIPQPLPYGNEHQSPQFRTPGSIIPSKYSTTGSQTLPSEHNVAGSQTLPSEFNVTGSQNLPSEFNAADNQTLPSTLNTSGTQTLPSEFDIARSENLPYGQKIPGSTEIPFGTQSSNNNSLPFGSGGPGGSTLPPSTGVHEASVPSVKDQTCNNSVPGHHNLPHTESVPYIPGTMLSQDGNLRTKPTIQSEQHPYMPGKESTIHGFQSGGSEPVNQLALQEARNLTTGTAGNMGVSGDEKLKQAGLVSLPHLSAMTPATSTTEAVQAPYGAQLDTVRGGVMMAPGTDVNVLFPAESRVLGEGGGGAKSGTMSGQHSKFSCQYCTQPLNVGDVAVFCERAGPDKCWHPACFSCFTCHELLADLIYFYQDGKVYCGRHFTQAAHMPRCTACDELVFGNSWTRADGFDWHLHHFCCYMCDTPLAGQRYVPDKEGCPYCLPCYMSYLAKMCESCEEKILPEESRCGHRGYFYHGNAQCFSCHTCHTPLINKKFKMSKNWLFCSNECIQAVAEEIHNNPNPKEKV
ncbi:hypothetical protein Pcinc_027544 [Petrolisthes cinctipes]|uniref:phosphatidylserine decarboxylase n=1 Tax=Petrolisthes cinctipes TaxID=88211 RepID=A0AAE1F5T5_PETCI|nr:hypothetical protein Pcinc_027544 [Petrolisthes cinctipes]